MKNCNVAIRQRARPSGNTALLLQFYWNGKRREESLKLYLVPEKTREDKRKNKETLALAEAIRAERETQIKNDTFNIIEVADGVKFFDFFSQLTAERRKDDSVGNLGNWTSCLKHLREYEKKDILLADITTEWVIGFRKFLTTTTTCINAGNHKLSKNSCTSYFNKLKACLKEARKRKLIFTDPSEDVESPETEEGKRMYLTIDELKTLSQAECQSEPVRKAFLFSCLTGLRRSDVLRIKWSDVSEMNGLTRIIFRQKKTSNLQYLDINKQAAEIMGERPSIDGFVFPYLPAPYQTNCILQTWVGTAGIKKKISFHCGRHTFATMLLSLGTDLYTVSKLLGHTEIKTTQIYAKVLDKDRQEAVKKIPDISI